MRWRERSNWGVLMAPGRTTQTSTGEPPFCSSTRADSRNVLPAAFDEQYAAWSGMPR